MASLLENWAWKYFETIDDKQIRCKICGISFNASGKILTSHKTHLFYEHNISDAEEIRAWRIEQSTNPVWQYVKKEGIFAVRCNFCEEIVEHTYDISKIERHCSPHFQDIEDSIKNTWLHHHLTFNKNLKRIFCFYCKDFLLQSLIGIQDMKDHLFVTHDLRDTTKRKRDKDEKTEENNTDVLKRTKTEENNASTNFQ